MPQQLASFPGLKTGRGYSAVVLDRSQTRPALRRFSVPECWPRAGNETTLVSRGYLSSCSSSTPWFLLCPRLTQPVFCCFNSAERCHVRFYVSLWGSSVVCVGHFENTIVPYRRSTPEASLCELQYRLPLSRLRFTLGTWL